MTTFRTLIGKLAGQKAHVLLAGQVVEVTVQKVVSDIVQLTLTKPLFGATELTLHVDSLVLVTDGTT